MQLKKCTQNKIKIQGTNIKFYTNNLYFLVTEEHTTTLLKLEEVK